MKLFRRFFHDLNEIYRDPYPGISVHYVGEKLGNYKTCGYLDCDECHDVQIEARACLTLTTSSGPFQNIPLHFEVLIPPDYPTRPPRILASTKLKHPHIYERWICSDILIANEENRYARPEVPKSENYRGGYTPAYTLFGVALQMLSFLSDESIENIQGGTSKQQWDWELFDILKSCSYATNNKLFDCKHCGYDGSEIMEDLEDDVYVSKLLHEKRITQKRQPQSKGTPNFPMNVEYRKRAVKIYALMLRVPTELWLQILELIPTSMFPIVKNALPLVHDITKIVTIKRELYCFYSKEDYKNAILGFGVHFEKDGNQGLMVSEFEYLSYEAFEEYKVRKSVWKNEFEYFLPFAICEDHFSRSFTIFNECAKHLAKLTIKKNVKALQSVDESAATLNLLVKFMNNIVLTLFKQVGSGKDRQTMVAASEKAVQGYVSVLHLVLSLIKRTPELGELIEARVADFVQYPEFRMKDKTPDLGEWLIYLGLSQKYYWNNEVSKVVIPQFLSRTVMWMLRRKVDSCPNKNAVFPYLHLAYLETDAVSELRLSETFTATQTSLRLLLFQVYFLTKILRPSQSTTNAVILDSLERNFGRPDEQILTNTFNAIKVIQGVNNYGAFFKLVGAGYESGSKESVCKMLKEAILDSERFGYHMHFSKKELFERRKAALIRVQGKRLQR
ncbi:hypothetical protein HK098_007137 [Nowakowskiella sp. JEL0407]|nr:hypothetical protein HK098_007137 [Nowakowskiella sp. JEL0407]